MIKDFIEENQTKIIEDVIELINIPTLYSDQVGEGAPFGPNIKEGLEAVLNMAEKMGMETKNYQGYMGEVTVGTGDYLIGILCHIDVVSPGEDWETDPFKGQVIDGKIYGRGSIDDKGPVVSSLYAMKYLMDSGKILDGFRLRLIIGTDEEELWREVDYYMEKATELPDIAIVPDGYFPLVFCEKGLIDFDITTQVSVDLKSPIQVVSLSGGSGRNIVAGKARALLEFTGEDGLNIIDKTKEVFENAEYIQVEKVSERRLELVAQGKSTHAMAPEKGVNAIGHLMAALGQIQEDLSHGELVEKFNKYIGLDYYGGNFGCSFEDQVSGKLTFNIGTLGLEEMVDGKVKAILESNLRYPASEKYQVVKDAMDKTAAEGQFNIDEKAIMAPIHIEQDSTLVKTLMEAYVRVTGDTENQPFAIGGATYARAIPNAVAFGPLFPYEEELAHEANEFLSVDSLMKMTEIYGEALEMLMKRGPLDN